MKKRIATLLLALGCAHAMAQEVVISGRVLDTAGSKTVDKPIPLVMVEVRDANGAVLGNNPTNANGMFHIAFADKSKLTGKEQIWVDAPGYSARLTKVPIKYPPPPGIKLALQGDVLLTNNKAMRESAEYRIAVARNAAEAHADTARPERARLVFASLSALPPESKQAAFGSLKALNVQAYSELVRVDADVTRVNELQDDYRKKGWNVVPMIDTMGNLRLTGPVTSKDEMDSAVHQAGQKGFNQKVLINEMQVRRN